jgi:hypothetical protein
MNDAVLAEPQEAAWSLGTRLDRGMHRVTVTCLADEIDRMGRVVQARCREELQYGPKLCEEHHFHHVTVKTCGRILRKPQVQPGISSAHKVPNMPLDDAFVTILADGRVFLSNKPAYESDTVVNPMRPLKFFEGYRGHEIAALNAVLAYLNDHA